MPEIAVWLIIAAPLAAAVFNGLVIRPLFGPVSRVAFDATAGSIAISFILSLWALSAVWTDQEVVLPLHEIIRVDEFSLRIGLLLDGLTAIMLVVVTSVSLLVQIYSHGYMRDDRSYVRYYTFKISIHRESTKISHALKAHHRNGCKLIVSMAFQSHFINILEMLHSAFSFARRLTTLKLFYSTL